jgi:predicted GNAT family acetyltransferase
MHVEIRRRDDVARYEMVIDGTVVSYADYHDDGERVVLPHTVTLPPYRDRGYAAQVVRRALDDARAEGRTVVPLCWFVAEFIDEHPEYRDLVAAR